MSRLTVLLAIAGALGASACDPPDREAVQISRNCTKARETGDLSKKYLARMSLAPDWATLGWGRQIAAVKWMACENRIANHRPIDDCLDRLSYDSRQKDLPIQTAIAQCIEKAKRKH